jgi:hypothetical protein
MVGRIMPNFIEVRQGDSFTIPLLFREGKSAVDLTGAVLKMQVRTKDDNKAVISKTGSIDDAVHGKASVQIAPSDTKNLVVGEDYVTDIQITFANGEVHTVYPAQIGQVAAFVVGQNVTE